MIVDTSALVAVLRNEPERAVIREALLTAATSRSPVEMSAASYVELGIVVDRESDPVRSRRVDELLREFQIEVTALDSHQARVGRQAYRDFGKGSGHPARLNFGDCFSYALASVRHEPLLFVGQDFTHTDIRSVL